LVTADHSGYSDFNLLPVTSPNRISETHQFVLTGYEPRIKLN
jgi:hypothetical protein